MRFRKNTYTVDEVSRAINNAKSVRTVCRVNPMTDVPEIVRTFVMRLGDESIEFAITYTVDIQM